MISKKSFKISLTCARINKQHANFIAQEFVYDTFSNYMLQVQSTEVHLIH